MSAEVASTETPWRAERWRRLIARSAGWARWPGSNAREPAVTYGIPVVLAAAAVQFWFRIDGELASGDLVPPIVPGSDYLAHWNDTSDGAGGPGFTIVALPYAQGLRVFHALGLGEAAFQRVWLTVFVAGAAAAVVFLARSLFASPLAAVVAGVVSTFSAYRLVVGFDWVPIAATLAAALLGGLVLRRGRSDGGPPAVVFAAVSLLLGPVFLNPPHAVLVLAWVAVCVLLAWAVYGAVALGRIGRFLIKAAPLAGVFNLWWIVPALLTVTSSVFAQQFTAAGVGDWEWTHQRASIWNVLSLTSSWAWSQPAYYPISAGLEALPFNVLKFAPAVVAVVAIFLARGSSRRVGYVLGGTGLVAVVVMKGLHPPLRQVNLSLYDHVPGFWLFRDPSKVALVLVLVYSLLAALVVVELQRRSVALAAAAAAGIATAAIVYAHPLLTGGLIAGKRPLLPPAHVHVPAGWRQAAAYVDALPDPGKAIVLPELDYYQAPTTWGYYGASFFHQLFRRPLIEPLPGGYYSDPVVSQLVGDLQEEMLDRRADVRPILRALGARYVLLRRDLNTRFPGRSFVAPAKLAPAFARRRELRRLRSFGVVDLYETTGASAPEVYPALPVVVRGTSSSSLYGSFELGANSALVSARASSSLAGISPGEATLVPIRPTPSAKGSSLRQAGTAVAAEGGRVKLRFPRLAAPVRVTVGRRAFVVPAGAARTRVLPFVSSNAPTIYRFLSLDRIRALPIKKALVRRLGDCNAYNDLTPKEAGLSAFVRRQGGGVATLRLGAVAHAACVAIRIRGAAATAPLRLHLSYRRLSGNPPRVCVWEVVRTGAPRRRASRPPGTGDGSKRRSDSPQERRRPGCSSMRTAEPRSRPPRNTAIFGSSRRSLRSRSESRRSPVCPTSDTSASRRTSSVFTSEAPGSRSWSCSARPSRRDGGWRAATAAP